MLVSNTNAHYQNSPLIIEYKFVKFDRNSGTKLLVSKNIKYFAECSLLSKELLPLQISTIHEAMREWEKITNVKFVYQEENPKLLITASNLNFFNNNKNEEILGAGWEINYKKQQVIFIDKNVGFVNKENAKWLILHELGHVPFLLEHLSKYSTDIQNTFDNSLLSVMSYNHKKNSHDKIIYPVTPSHLDISLVQKKFGANKISTNNDDVYKFSLETYGHHTIYDSGGIDTIDLSNFHQNLHITLNNGPHNINYVSSTFSFSIYKSSIIENIYTGNGNDIIYGNNANNRINAGSGINTIYGGGGSNFFIFKKENHSKNVIKDFNLKQDKIILEGFDLTCNKFMQIITINHQQVFINPAPHVSIELQGNYLALTCDDIIFS